MGLLASCADYPQTAAILAKSADLPHQAQVSNVRFLPHVEEQGAPAALAMALNWSGASSEVATLAPKLKGGKLQAEIIDEARQHGRSAYPVTDLRAVLQEVAAGHPVLVRQEPSGRPTPVWRYALVVGYDLDSKMLLVHSGRLEQVKLPFQVFEGNWQRADNWGVVVMAPSQPPASAVALAAYRSNRVTALAQAAPAVTPSTRVAAAKPVAATRMADVAPTKPPEAGSQQTPKLAASGPDQAKQGQAAKTAPRSAAQVANMPDPESAKTHTATSPKNSTASRNVPIDPGLARLLSVIPAPHQG